jgi:hypothetical protein
LETLRLEQRVGGQRTDEPEPFPAQFFQDRDDDFDFLAPQMPALARMRVEAGHDDPRLCNGEPRDKIPMENAQR